MKRIISVCMLCVLIAVSIFTGCKDRNGYIVRYDITMEEINYFYKGTDPVNEHLTMGNIKNALGLPHGMSINWRGYTEYEYNTAFGMLYFVDLPGKNYYGIYADLFPEVEEPKSFDVEDVTIDPNRYKMERRFDIDEDELNFINIETTPSELQQILGAPHSMMYGLPENIVIGIYIYGLEDKNVFKVVYSGFGHIYKAWVEDKKGNELYTIAAYKPKEE